VDFNIFMAVALLAAAGIAVEDVAHLVSFFVNAKGTPTERLGFAMRATFAAILQGSLSTLLNILPMGWHDVPFYRDYFCVPFTTIVFVGLVNGLFFTPGMLAFTSYVASRCTGGTLVKEVAV